jgi:hypothetical protein
MASQPNPTEFDPTEEEDPLVTKYVEAALAPCIGRMPPAALAVMRARLYLFYETNPEAVALLNEIREAQKTAPVVEHSGDQVRRDIAALQSAGRATKSAKGSGR